MRLWLLDQVADVQSSLEGLIHVMVERADKERDILLPGYTHLQVRALALSIPVCACGRADRSGPAARSTDPMVPLLALARIFVQQRPRPSTPTRLARLCPPARQRCPRWQPLCRRPRIPCPRTWFCVPGREQYVGRRRSRLYRRVSDVGQFDDDAHESVGGRFDRVLDGRVWVRHVERCV